MTLRDDNGPLYTVQYLKGRLCGALSDLEQVEADISRLSQRADDPTVPHGYPSWKDYALALERIGDVTDRHRAQLEREIAELRNLVDGDEDPTEPPQGYSTWLEYYKTQAQRREPDARMQALIDENEELRAKVSRQRRELKQVNRCIREQKLELEVLRGRETVEKVEFIWSEPVPIGPGIMNFNTDNGGAVPQGKVWVGETLPDVIRPVDGFTKLDKRDASPVSGSEPGDSVCHAVCVSGRSGTVTIHKDGTVVLTGDIVVKDGRKK